MITDEAGHSVDSVRREDLQLFDDGNPQPISYFSKEELPVTYGLVIDSSGSMRDLYAEVIGGAKAIVNANRQNDQAFIISFVSSDKIRTAQELTSDKNILIAALDTLYVELGQTALVDALYLAADYSLKHRQSEAPRRMSLVLVSDGEDRASYYSESKLFKLLGTTDLQVFTIGLVGQLEKQDPRKPISAKSPRQSIDFLKRLARETGGRAFILKSNQELPDVIGQINHDLHTQYVVGFRPVSNPSQVSRKVEVRLVGSPEHVKWTVTTRRISGAEN